MTDRPFLDYVFDIRKAGARFSDSTFERVEVGMADKRFEIKELVGNDAQGKFIYRIVEVPDGKWVVSVLTSSVGDQVDDLYNDHDETRVVCRGSSKEMERLYEIVGAESLSRHLVEDCRSSQDYSSQRSWHHQRREILVGDDPFGVILIDAENGVRSPHRRFVSARQVHKGELGHESPYLRPALAREGRDEDYQYWRSEGYVEGDKPLRRPCWARLVDVAEVVGMMSMDLVRTFYPFADTMGRGLPVVFAASREEIHGKYLPLDAVKRFTESDFPELLDRNPTSIWLRDGFAKTVLRLHALGYKPDAILMGHA